MSAPLIVWAGVAVTTASVFGFALTQRQPAPAPGMTVGALYGVALSRRRRPAGTTT